MLRLWSSLMGKLARLQPTPQVGRHAYATGRARSGVHFGHPELRAAAAANDPEIVNTLSSAPVSRRGFGMGSIPPNLARRQALERSTGPRKYELPRSLTGEHLGSVAQVHTFKDACSCNFVRLR